MLLICDAPWITLTVPAAMMSMCSQMYTWYISYANVCMYIHVSSGVSGLAASLIVGKRKGFGQVCYV